MAARRLMQVVIMLGGLLAWALQFTVIYGVTSVACVLGWADRTILGFHLVPASVALTTLLALAVAALTLAVSVRQYRRLNEEQGSETDTFLTYSALTISGFSLVVIAWHGVPAFLLPSCS